MKNITSFTALFREYDAIRMLAIQHLAVRYRQPYLGFLWAFVVPLCLAGIFYVVFSLLLRIEIKEYPFFLYLVTALFAWEYFSVSIREGTVSIVENRDIVKETPVRRECLPLAVVAAHAVSFLPSFLIVIVLLVVFGIDISWRILILPLVFALQTVLIVGVVLCTSALYVRFRDIRYGLEMLLTVMFYMTPVFYSLSLVEQYMGPFALKLYMLNPMVGFSVMYRWCLLPGYVGTMPAEANMFLIVFVPLILAGVMVWFGSKYFKKQQRFFSEHMVR